MKIPDWQWLKRRMDMDKADDELDRAMEELAECHRELEGILKQWNPDWHEEVFRRLKRIRQNAGVFDLPKLRCGGIFIYSLN